MATSTDVGRREDRAARGRALAGSIAVVAACWVVLAWPMVLGAFVASRHDVGAFTPGWYAAALVPEAGYLALIVLAVAVRVAHTGNRPDRSDGPHRTGPRPHRAAAHRPPAGGTSSSRVRADRDVSPV